MMEWLNMLMQPQNMGALAGQLAQKGPPPMEMLAGMGAQGTGAPQMSQIPGAPDSFAGMMQQVGANGYQPMQPSPDGQTLMPMPAPQMSVDPNAQPAPTPLQFGPQAEPQQPQGLSAQQMAQLMGQGGQGQPQPRAPGAPGLAGPASVRDPQMLQAQAQGARPSLAQLLYGR